MQNYTQQMCGGITMNLDRVIAVRNTKTVYRDGDMCIKIFGDEYSEIDVLNEALNQAKAKETGLMVPKVYEVRMIDKNWAIVSQFIKGKTLYQLMKECPQNEVKYIDLLVSLQLDIHNKKSYSFCSLTEKLMFKINKTKLDSPTKEKLIARLEEMPKHTKLCHGDFCPSNIIIENNETPYIIDWSHAGQGNALADVAKTYLILYLKYNEDTAKKYLDIFCNKSCISKESIKKWIPIIASTELLKCNYSEKEILMNFVRTDKYEK